jgi:hypothetical protein
MAEQKAKARAAWSGSGEAADAAIWFDLAEEHGATEFLGYDTETAEGQVLALVKGRGTRRHRAGGRCGKIVVNQTPFYAEAGGQVGDTGLKTETGRPRSPTRARLRGFPAHGRSGRGRDRPRAPAVLEVDHARRGTIRANHSATHLLHEALRQRARRSRRAARLAQRAGPAALRLQPRQGADTGGAGAGRAGGERLHPPERAGGDPDHDAGRRARDRGAGAFWREIRRRGARRVDGHARGVGQGPRRADLFAGALRRHACSSDRRYRAVRDPWATARRRRACAGSRR